MHSLQILAAISENIKMMISRAAEGANADTAISRLCDKIIPSDWEYDTRVLFNTALRVTYCIESAYVLENVLKRVSDTVLEQVGQLGIPIPFLECECMRRKGMVRNWTISQEENSEHGKSVHYTLEPYTPAKFERLNYS